MALTSACCAKLSLLAVLAFVLLCVHTVMCEEKGDKIIILPNKHHEYGHKEQYIPYPIMMPYGHGGGGYGGMSHSYGGYGGGFGGFGGYGGMGEMMHGY